MLQIAKQPGQRILELGGGHNRHPASDVNVDIRSGPGVDFTVDFEEPDWSIKAEEFDGVISIFCLEHCSYRKAPNFLKEAFRVIKPGGWACFVTPNTEEQLRFIQNHQEGWDGRSPFDSMSCILFGDQTYDANAHKSFWSPTLASKLFSEAGFVDVITEPFGARSTDLKITARKPATAPFEPGAPTPPPPAPTITRIAPTPPPAQPMKPAAETYNLHYFENYQSSGFYWDYPSNRLVAQRILDKQPTSVLELGCARGYVLKQIQDAGISYAHGLDVSRHAWLTRVCDPINLHDLTQTPWPVGSQEYDLCYSVSLLEHIPEAHLPDFMDEMTRVCKRGWHAVTLDGLAPSHDPSRIALKGIEFWKKMLPEGHEVVDVREAQAGGLSEEYIKGTPGKVKLNIGCAFTLYHQGWLNIDIIDGENFAKAFNYAFMKHDVRNGIPFGTSTVDRLFFHHVLEHFTYEELGRLLKECRRVIRPDGCMRVVVPDTSELTQLYHNRPGLAGLDEMNLGCARAATPAGKLWSILGEGHKCYLDVEALKNMLAEAGWESHSASFRQTSIPGVGEILRETTEMSYGGTSLAIDAIPRIG